VIAAPPVLIVRPDPTWPEGHDIADLAAAGWDRARLLDFIEKNAVAAEVLRPEVVEKRGAAVQGDILVAERFLAKHDKDVRYCPTRGWLIWDGKRWAWDQLEGVNVLCEEVVKDFYREAADIKDDTERMALVRFAIASSKVDRLRGALAVARTHVAVLQDDLDKGEYFLNCANGTVDLRDGTLGPADREALITKLIDFEYAENTPAPRFEQFLQEVFEGKLELIAYLQRAIGYSFTADLSEQCLHILHGGGANGKSSLIDVLLKVAGDYGQTAPAQMILTKFGTGIPTDIARLCGARMVAMSETGEAKELDEATVKTLTSVEPIPARFLHRDFFEFRPTHHLWLSSNYRPKIGGTDHGIWRRIRLIPFTQTFEINPSVPKELEAEIPGILAWIVAGAVRWYREGLEAPLEISRATKAYRSEQDVLDDFLKECCEEDPSAGNILAKDLYELYKAWAKESGEDVWSKKFLGRRLADRGFTSGRTSHTNVATWRGLSAKFYAKD